MTRGSFRARTRRCQRLSWSPMGKKDSSETPQELGETLNSVPGFVERRVIPIIQGISGLTQSDRKQLVGVAGRLLQAAILGKFEEFSIEWNDLKSAGRIKEEFVTRPKSQAALLELLQFIDQSPPEQDLFDAIKSIFFRGIAPDSTDIDSLRSYEFLQVARKLNSGDILVLKACLNLREKGSVAPGNSSHRWVDAIAKETNLPTGVVEIHEQNLNRSRLIGDRIYPDKSGMMNSETYGLTQFGLEFGSFVTAYQRPGDKGSFRFP